MNQVELLRKKEKSKEPRKTLGKHVRTPPPKKNEALGTQGEGAAR